jgi:phage protein D/phage baseplate assembly protein gpV
MTGAVAVPQVSVGGQPLSDECARLLEITVVEDHVMLPARFELHFRDPHAVVLDRSGLRMAAEVSIGVPEPSGAVQELVRGDVVTLEVLFDEHGSRVIARGFDRAHRLTRGARTESYRDVTDADVLRTLAGRASVPLGRVEDPGIVHAILHQIGQSDWSFLSSRAQEVGYALGLRDGKLDFAPVAAASDGPDPGDYAATNPLQLVLGRNLESFRLNLSAAAQVSRVEVRGWDRDRRMAVVGQAQAGTRAAAARSGPELLAAAVGSPAHSDVRGSFASQAEVDAAARAVAEDIGATSVAADGTAFGDPALRAGRAISIGRVGPDFEGRFLLSATRHRLDARGYRTHITVSGRHDASLPGLVADLAARGAPRLPGLAAGIVSDVGDPAGQGRVKVHLPWLGDDVETDWLRAVQLLAGSGHGAAFLPDVGDEVLVGFERGDGRRGFVLGALFNGIDAAQVDGAPVSGGHVVRRGIASKAGHRLVFVESGPAKVELHGAGDVTVEAAGDLTLEATGRLTLSAQRGIEIDGGAGSVDVKGLTINLG